MINCWSMGHKFLNSPAASAAKSNLTSVHMYHTNVLHCDHSIFLAFCVTITRDSIQTKTAIIEAAGALFAENGFSSVTARKVAADAGVSLSSIPYHFKTMEHLYECVVLEASRIAPEADQLIEQSLKAKPELAVRLAVEWLIVDFESANTSWRHKLVRREEFEPTKGFEGVVEQVYAPAFEWLCQVLGRACDEPAGSPHVRFGAISMYAFTIGQLGRMELIEMLAPEVSESLCDRGQLIELMAAQALDSIRLYRDQFANQAVTDLAEAE